MYSIFIPWLRPHSSELYSEVRSLGDREGNQVWKMSRKYSYGGAISFGVLPGT